MCFPEFFELFMRESWGLNYSQSIRSINNNLELVIDFKSEVGIWGYLQVVSEQAARVGHSTYAKPTHLTSEVEMKCAISMRVK